MSTPHEVARLETPHLVGFEVVPAEDRSRYNLADDGVVWYRLCFRWVDHIDNVFVKAADRMPMRREAAEAWRRRMLELLLEGCSK